MVRLLSSAWAEGRLDLPLFRDEPADVVSLEAALRSPEFAHAGGGLAPGASAPASNKELECH
ncbi:MAG: hypothetical protein HY508_08825 [Acidobacteria bacterium]|nr:hypothetical protein [Acidobacteriota bacterium]